MARRGRPAAHPQQQCNTQLSPQHMYATCLNSCARCARHLLWAWPCLAGCVQLKDKVKKPVVVVLGFGWGSHALIKVRGT